MSVCRQRTTVRSATENLTIKHISCVNRNMQANAVNTPLPHWSSCLTFLGARYHRQSAETGKIVAMITQCSKLRKLAGMRHLRSCQAFSTPETNCARSHDDNRLPTLVCCSILRTRTRSASGTTFLIAPTCRRRNTDAVSIWRVEQTPAKHVAEWASTCACSPAAPLCINSPPWTF